PADPNLGHRSPDNIPTLRTSMRYVRFSAVESANRIWLQSREAFWLYLTAWITFGAAFAAIFVLSNKVTAWTAAVMTFQVIWPAALLSVAAIWTIAKIPPRLPWLAAHVPLAVLYSASWTALVCISTTVQRGLASGKWIWSLPPQHVLHWHGFSGVLV